MSFSSSSRRASVGNERGIALIVTLMVLMLVSALMVGFVTAVVADQRSSGLERDQTQAYAAAHAGLEKLTADLSDVIDANFSPTAAELAAKEATPPDLPGFVYLEPGGTSGYQINFTANAQGNPAPENVNGSTISAGPYQGFRGIITPYEVMVTARSCPGGNCASDLGGAEVRMRRTLQTVLVPVFQFGFFSENDLSFHAGADFNFGGRVHSNGTVYLAQTDNTTLTLADRVTAVGEVVRTHLSNGWDNVSGYNGTVRVIRTAPSTFRNLARTEGSLVTNNPAVQNEPLWTSLSVGTYASNIRNGRTGARRLDLPLVSQGAQPIDLIRRPVANEDTTRPRVLEQRFFSQAGIRILLSDTAADITSLPGVTGTPIPLGNLATTPVVGYTPGGMVAPFAISAGTPTTEYTSPAGTALLNGFILIEQRRSGGWADITLEILNLGTTARNLSSGVVNTVGTACPSEPHANAVIRIQRLKDVPRTNPNQSSTNQSNWRCGVYGGVISPVATDYWPLALYDAREGNYRDTGAAGAVALGGIMQYIELDVRNLKRWIEGAIAGSGSQTSSENGFIVYFSDRRNNRNVTNEETGEYGFEDFLNVANATWAENGTLNQGEDVNGDNALQIYGRTPQNVPGSSVAPWNGTARPWTTTTAITVARANRQIFFRRALKIVNGGLDQLPVPGLTIASENPVYVQGNFNANATDTTAEPNRAAAVIADAVTVLSNNWNDIRSFTSSNTIGGRPAQTTGYRMAVVGGKSIPFVRPTGWTPERDFGTDGGAHNFLRYLEDWGGQTLNYRGSIVSFYTSRQAVGAYKCCATVYGAPTRGYNFDTDFLIPSLLPPGTPMFRDVNTLTFRQLLRPTQ